ncbi:YihY/virulence factor BrkB family protein [Methylobacterium komagatae]|uniref:YihY/virulence factor BrkB family protein n=1 Tax=Methylobacterium komagatae TaxID=374425 RepID=A0ABW2BS61_9HYPH
MPGRRKVVAVIRRAVLAANDHGIGFMAAGVAFWSALALFPAVALLVWLAHHLLGVADVRDALRTVTHVMPDSVGDIVARAIQAASDGNPADRGADLGWPVGPAFGLLVSLWSVTVAMQALFHALDQTFEAEERRSWLRLTAVSLAFSVGALVVMACALAATVAMTHALAPIDGALPGTLARWATAFVTFLLTVATLYRVAPSGGREGLPFVTVGGVAAAAALVAECGLFSWVVGHFSTLDVTYGSLSTVAAFLLWLWVSVAIVLVGAELDVALYRGTGLYGGRSRSGGMSRQSAR